MKLTFATKKDQLKLLKILMRTPARKGGYFVIDENFYDLFPFPEHKVNQILTALDEQGIIHLIAPANMKYPCFQILQKAYSFIPEQQEINKRFFIPLVISIIALVKSFDKEILSLLALLWKLLKQ